MTVSPEASPIVVEFDETIKSVVLAWRVPVTIKLPVTDILPSTVTSPEGVVILVNFTVPIIYFPIPYISMFKIKKRP